MLCSGQYTRPLLRGQYWAGNAHPFLLGRLQALPSLKGLFAIHKNVATGPEVNAAPENTANLTAPEPNAPPESAQTFVATVDGTAKQFSVLNTRTKDVRSFPVQ